MRATSHPVQPYPASRYHHQRRLHAFRRRVTMSGSGSTLITYYSVAPTAIPIASTTPLRGDQQPAAAHFADELDDIVATDDDVAASSSSSSGTHYSSIGGRNSPFFYPLDGFGDEENQRSPTYETGYRGLKTTPENINLIAESTLPTALPSLKKTAIFCRLNLFSPVCLLELSCILKFDPNGNC